MVSAESLLAARDLSLYRPRQLEDTEFREIRGSVSFSISESTGLNGGGHQIRAYLEFSTSILIHLYLGEEQGLNGGVQRRRQASPLAESEMHSRAGKGEHLTDTGEDSAVNFTV